MNEALNTRQGRDWWRCGRADVFDVLNSKLSREKTAKRPVGS